MTPKEWFALFGFYAAYLFFGASVFYHNEHALETVRRRDELTERIEINAITVVKLPSASTARKLQAILDAVGRSEIDGDTGPLASAKAKDVRTWACSCSGSSISELTSISRTPVAISIRSPLPAAGRILCQSLSTRAFCCCCCCSWICPKGGPPDHKCAVPTQIIITTRTTPPNPADRVCVCVCKFVHERTRLASANWWEDLPAPSQVRCSI